jgi:DNA-binding response OmpR family regulator
MHGRTVLIIEDDPKTRATVELYFRHAGAEVHAAADGAEGLAAARRLDPDLVILDLMLPGLDGVALCRTLRTESAVPLIMLTARTTESDKLLGLDVGADDYVSKPFSPRELVARARAVLRRSRDAVSARVVAGDVVVDLARCEARVAGAEVQLTATELRLLAALARNRGRAFTREELVRRVHVKNLRRKIGAARIATVFGIGYKLL